MIRLLRPRASWPAWLGVLIPLTLAGCQREVTEPPAEPDGEGVLFRPLQWTFTGTAYVSDPAGNPLAGVNARLEVWASTGDDFGGGEEEGNVTLYFCSDAEFTDSRGQAYLSCTIYNDVDHIDPLRLRLSDSRYSLLSTETLDRSAMTIEKRYVVIRDEDHNRVTDDVELPLARKFAPKLILTARDGGVRPSPVEIMDRNGDRRLGWEDALIAVRTINGDYVGDFRPDEMLFYGEGRHPCGGGLFHSGETQYPYLTAMSKYWIVPRFHIEGSTCVWDYPQGLYIMMPHYEWGPLGVTEPQFWQQEYQEVLARNAGDSRYTDGMTYVDLFRSDADEIVVQYWFFYPFNDSGNRHEGDWEHINVVLNSENIAAADIVRVEYYFHEKVEVARIPGQDYELVDGTHPLVYVGGYTESCDLNGYGTHGSYSRSGTISNINPIGSSEIVGGDGLEIDFNGYRNLYLMKNELPRTVYSLDPLSTYDPGWQHFAGLWGHPLSKPVPCGGLLNELGELLKGWANDFPLGRPFAEIARWALNNLLGVAAQTLEDTNFAPPGPRYNTRWQVTKTASE